MEGHVPDAIRVSSHKKLCPSDLAPAGTADTPFQTAGAVQLDGPGREGRIECDVCPLFACLSQSLSLVAVLPFMLSGIWTWL